MGYPIHHGGPGPLQELKATDAWTLFQSIDHNEDFKINLEAIEKKGEVGNGSDVMKVS